MAIAPKNLCTKSWPLCLTIEDQHVLGHAKRAKDAADSFGGTSRSAWCLSLTQSGVLACASLPDKVFPQALRPASSEGLGTWIGLPWQTACLLGRAMYGAGCLLGATAGLLIAPLISLVQALVCALPPPPAAIKSPSDTAGQEEEQESLSSKEDLPVSILPGLSQVPSDSAATGSASGPEKEGDIGTTREFVAAWLPEEIDEAAAFVKDGSAQESVHEDTSIYLSDAGEISTLHSETEIVTDDEILNGSRLTSNNGAEAHLPAMLAPQATPHFTDLSLSGPTAKRIYDQLIKKGIQLRDRERKPFAEAMQRAHDELQDARFSELLEVLGMGDSDFADARILRLCYGLDETPRMSYDIHEQQTQLGLKPWTRFLDIAQVLTVSSTEEKDVAVWTALANLGLEDREQLGKFTTGFKEFFSARCVGPSDTPEGRDAAQRRDDEIVGSFCLHYFGHIIVKCRHLLHSPEQMGQLANTLWKLSADEDGAMKASNLHLIVPKYLKIDNLNNLALLSFFVEKIPTKNLSVEERYNFIENIVDVPKGELNACADMINNDYKTLFERLDDPWSKASFVKLLSDTMNDAFKSQQHFDVIFKRLNTLAGEITTQEDVRLLGSNIKLLQLAGADPRIEGIEEMEGPSEVFSALMAKLAKDHQKHDNMALGIAQAVA